MTVCVRKNVNVNGSFADTNSPTFSLIVEPQEIKCECASVGRSFYNLIYMRMLSGTNLVERFNDQFQPMLLNEKNLWFSSNSTVIRMPLSTEFLKEGYDSGYQRLQQVLGRFTENASKTLLFLKSVFQVLS